MPFGLTPWARRLNAQIEHAFRRQRIDEIMAKLDELQPISVMTGCLKCGAHANCPSHQAANWWQRFHEHFEQN